MEFQQAVGLIVCVLLGAVASSEPGEEGLSAEFRLLESLLSSDRYRPQARPVLKSDQVLNVHFKFLLGRIESLEEKTQVLTSFGWLVVSWTDQFLHWDPAAYGSTHKLVVETYHIWMPEIVIMNNVVEGNDISLTARFRAAIYHTGLVVWAPGFKFQTACTVDLTYFPFDKQTCWIKVTNWSFTSSAVNFSLADDAQSMLKYYQPNAEWILVDTHTEEGVIEKTQSESMAAKTASEGRDPERADAPLVSFGITMQRRPKFYLLNVLVPCTVMTLASILVFVLPCDCGEKVSLAISVLLSYSVLMMYFASNMPKNSEAIPLLSWFMTIGMALTTLSLLLTVLTLNLHHRSPELPVPRVLALVVLGWFGRLLCMPSSSKAKQATQKNTPSNPHETRDQYYPSIAVSSSRRYKSSSADDEVSVLGDECSRCQRSLPRNPSFKVFTTQEDMVAIEKAGPGSAPDEPNDWQKLAAVLDRFFLIIYTFSVLVISAAMIVAICQNTQLPEASRAPSSSG